MELFKFKPLLKQTLWGGEKIKGFKHLQTDLEQVGESWEVSGVQGSETVVDGGTYDGCKLNELVAQLKEKLVGHENYERFGNEFPLLIKFIDARQDLSIQVHPSNEMAVCQGKPRGKTEMWYLLESDEGAQLYSGLNREITPEDYKQMVDNGTIVNALACHTVSEGDVFYIPGGRIHSIGAGCFLVEIQQTSDVTYRIYDFKRRDKNGNYRELHTELAAECIDYHVHDDYSIQYTPQPDESVPLVDCPYFTTAVYDLTEPMVLDYSELDSFVILIGLKGSGKLTCAGQTVSLEAGQTVLIPATAQEVKVEGIVKFLETFV